MSFITINKHFIFYLFIYANNRTYIKIAKTGYSSIDLYTFQIHKIIFLRTVLNRSCTDGDCTR